MTFAAGSLADGQLSDSQGAIYTVPASTTAYVRNLFLYNTNAATQTITLYLQRSGGTSREFRSLTLAQYESASVIADEQAILLSTGDEIEAVTTTATAVNYFIGGVLET